jgi:hypothetical protein
MCSAPSARSGSSASSLDRRTSNRRPLIPSPRAGLQKCPAGLALLIAGADSFIARPRTRQQTGLPEGSRKRSRDPRHAFPFGSVLAGSRRRWLQRTHDRRAVLLLVSAVRAKSPEAKTRSQKAGVSRPLQGVDGPGLAVASALSAAGFAVARPGAESDPSGERRRTSSEG